MHTRAAGARRTSGSQGPGSGATRSSLRSGGTQWRPPLPALAASSSNSWGSGSPDSGVPVPPPPPCGHRTRRRSWRASRPGRRMSWAPRPRPSLASAARLSPQSLPLLLSTRPSPNPRPGPLGSGCPILPGCPPSVSAFLARAAPKTSPKLAKFAPPVRSPPLTGRKGRCAGAQSPRPPPPVRCMSRSPGFARWRAVSSGGA